MRISSKGQVTIPKDVRDKAGLLEGTEVEFAVEGNVVTISRSPPGKRRGKTRGERFVDAIAGTTTLNRGLSTDELMTLLRGDD